MYKRKASVERNTKQKAPSRRPSNTSVNARTNVGQQKLQKPEKLPSTNNIIAPADSPKPTNKAVDVCMPKTRFSSQDRSRDSRSCSTPRLKSFPVEKIKKLDSPPPFSPKPIGALIAQQDPRESGVLYVSTPHEQRRDNGQGDSAAVTRHLHQRHQQQGMHSASQQQVVPQQAIHQIGQMNPHSESILPQQVANVQSHRPFVPHGSPDYSQNSPKNPHATSSNPPRILANPHSGAQQVPNGSMAVVEQGKIKNEDLTSDLDYEKQPVGGRNAAVYKRMMVNAHGQTPVDPATPNQYDVNLQHVHGRYPSASQVPSYTNPQNPQNPQHVYQQLQQNRLQQQQLQQRAANYQMQVMGSQPQLEGAQGANSYNSQQGGRYAPGQGMTSPQEAMPSQMKNPRMMGSIQQNYPAHQDDLDYGMNAQNGWSRNNGPAEYPSVKGQLKTYHVDVVNGNQPQYRIQNQQQQQFIPQNQQQQQFIPQNQQQQQFIPQNQQQQQFMPQNQQQQQFPPQNQQQQQFIPQNQQQQQQFMSHNKQQQQQFMSQNKQQQQQFIPQNQQQQQFMSQNKQQQQQFVPQNQQQQQFLPPNQQQQQFMPQYQQQPVHQLQRGTAMPQRHQNSMAYNQPGLNQQPPDSNPELQMGRKKSMKFSTSMVRDQEKLLATMKQQGVPMDVMKRQFELLLNEQRRHLEYLELIQQQKDSQEERKTEISVRRRKQQDEKPEWMIHLTPTRLPYLEIEKLHEQRRKEREANELEAMQQQQQQQMMMMREMPGQQVPVQAANQQNYQLWQQQQQQRVPQHYNNAYPQAPVVSAPAGNATEPMNPMNHQQNGPQYQYSHAQPHPHYNPQLQQYQQFYRAAPQQNQEQLQPPNNFPAYEGDNSPNELSSLLKLRRYRNEVRPQRRNNGLQNPEVAKKHLEDFKVSADARKGLEYLANLAPKKPIVRLNGIQDRSEAEAEFQQRMIASTFQPAAKAMSANGLANKRNPDNPLSQRLSSLKKSEQEYLKEYPRQKQNNLRNCYSVPAERENGSVAMGQLQPQQPSLGQMPTGLTQYNEKNQMVNHGGAMSYRFDGNFPQHYQQMQQYYLNSRNLARNNGEGDVGSTQRIEQSKGTFDHAGGDASENMNGAMNGQMAAGKMPYQGMYYNQANINESRTIGGVRYLARKQDYLPNQPILAPETLIANRHVQPPMMY